MTPLAGQTAQTIDGIAPTGSGHTLVLGVGNPLMGDDGVGIHAVELLAEREIPPGVEIADAGVPGWGLPAWFEGQEKVILIDAVHMGGTPGWWRRFRPEEVRLMASEKFLSLHEPGLANGLALAEALELLPEQVVLYGIEPGDCKIAQGLSPAVRDCLDSLVETLLFELWNGKLPYEQ